MRIVVYMPPCMYPYLPWWVYTTLYMYHPTHPGYTMPPCVLRLHVEQQRQCRVTRPWAQSRRNPWVGGLCAPLVPKSVTVVIHCCAELLRSSR